MQVTIEGSRSACTFLPTGQRMRVERTSFIDRLIRRGYVIVIAADPGPATMPGPR